MKRVLVIGCGGAGKSTFARTLGERTGLPVVHLDRLYWRPGWVEPAKDVWEATVRAELARNAWILDGNYGGTMDLRLAVADTCIFLDVPRATCLRRLVLRRFRLRGRTPEDRVEGCPERLTWEFVHYVWNYRAKRRPGVVARLAEFERRGGRAVVLRTDDEARSLLDRIGPSSAPGRTEEVR